MRVTNTILGRMQSASTCPKCNGSGQIISNRPSGSDANGMVEQEEAVSIKIPAGVEEGMQLKVTGKGNEAIGNGISGDLLVLIEESTDDNFICNFFCLLCIINYSWTSRYSWNFSL